MIQWPLPRYNWRIYGIISLPCLLIVRSYYYVYVLGFERSIDGWQIPHSDCLSQSCLVPQHPYSNLLAFQMKYPDDCNPLFRPYSGASYLASCTEYWKSLDISLSAVILYRFRSARGFFSACLLICNCYGQHPNFGFHTRRYKPLILLVTQGLLYLLVYGTWLLFWHRAPLGARLSTTIKSPNLSPRFSQLPAHLRLLYLFLTKNMISSLGISHMKRAWHRFQRFLKPHRSDPKPTAANAPPQPVPTHQSDNSVLISVPLNVRPFKDAPLEDLPAEIRRHLLSILEYERLKCLVHASPIYHHHYLLDRQYILCKCLENTFGSRVMMTDACAIYQSGLLNLSETNPKEKITRFLRSYQDC